MQDLESVFIHNIGLQESHFREFYKLSKVTTYQKKEHLLEEGQVCPFIGFVETGIIRSYIHANDKEYNNDFYLTNSLVTAFRSFLTQTPAISNIQALSTTTVRSITFNQLKQLESSSEIWLKFSKYIAEQLFIKKCKRETSLLRDTAKERFDQLLIDFPTIEQQVPQYQIASYLRIEPESLSRIKALTYINRI